MGRKLREILEVKECVEKPKLEVTFRNPREEYIYCEHGITIDELAKKWKGKRKGYNLASLKIRCTEENWRKYRKAFWEDCNAKREEEFKSQIINRDVEELVEATRRHKNLGMTMQNIFTSSLKKKGDKTFLVRSDGEEIPLKAGDVIRAGKEGFEIERKALGYTDQVIQISFAEDVMNQVFDIICKYIDDPSVVRNIQADFDQIKKKHQDQLEEFKP